MQQHHEQIQQLTTDNTQRNCMKAILQPIDESIGEQRTDSSTHLKRYLLASYSGDSSISVNTSGLRNEERYCAAIDTGKGESSK